jgi:beta-glucosidase-like glycosyl hydrolase
MSPRRRLAQLLVVGVNPTHARAAVDVVRAEHIGGIFLGGNVREQCTRSTSPKYGRQLTVPPREIHHAQAAARATQNTPDWQARYARRAGVEGTVRQAVAVTGTRRARYRGLPKTRLEHVYSAARAQPHPARRLLERARSGPHQNQPPHPPRTRARSLIELASRVQPVLKHLPGHGHATATRTEDP